MTYQEAFDELTRIVQQLENNQIGIDQLQPTLQRADALLRQCHAILTQTEAELGQLGQAQ